MSKPSELKRIYPVVEERLRQRRRLIWRLVRDAGVAGVTAPDLLQAVRVTHAVSTNRFYAALNEMADAHYLTRRFVVGVWVVDGDCRVPAGESAHLGPGWADENADLVGHVQQAAA